MNLNLNYKGFEKYLKESYIAHPMFLRGWPSDSIHYIFRFENGYGASVIKNFASYGHEDDLWELAVVVFEKDSDRYELVYDTDITCEVVGYQTDREIRNLLGRIKKLKPRVLEP